MSAWNGPAGKGAMRERRKTKRLQAEARDQLTFVERRRSYRRAPMTPVPPWNPAPGVAPVKAAT